MAIDFCTPTDVTKTVAVNDPARLTILITRASQFLREYLDRDNEQVARTERYGDFVLS